MSLFLGNLPHHVRRDELEFEFRRFGRCNIRMKEGFGFVMYDFPANAEKALRVLRGKNICGHPIDLTWANRQPKPFQRFRRGARFSEPYSGRSSSGRKDYEVRDGERSRFRTGFRGAVTEPVDEGEEFCVDDSLEKETGYSHDDDIDPIGEEDQEVEKDWLDEDDLLGLETGESERWGEPAGGPLDDKEAEDEGMFDRYRPSHGRDRRSKDYDYQRISSHGSPMRGRSQDKSRQDYISDTDKTHPVNSDPQRKCSICGLFGHKAYNCRHADASLPEKFARFDPHRDSGSKGLKRRRHSSQEKLFATSNPPLSRRYKIDRKTPGFGTPGELIKKELSSFAKETDPRGSNFERKKKRSKEDGYMMKNESKAKRFHLTRQPSNSVTSSSDLRLRSSRTCSSSRSRSRSVSSRTQSMSSGSMSSPSRSKSYRSRSKSISSASSPSKVHMECTGFNSKDCLEKDSGRGSKQLLIGQKQMAEHDGSSANVQLTRNGTPSCRNRSPFVTLEVEEKNKSGAWNEDGERCPYGTGYEVKGSHITREKGIAAGDNLSSDDLGERKDHKISRSQTMEATQVSSKDKNPVISQSKSSVIISSQEMCKVLQHYGLAVPTENRESLSVDDYFSSARLWPWEIIYYRRLKKGPISTENYARRTAQNEEFGIVDKYIRSSSGWFE